MKEDKIPANKSSFWGIRCESGKKYSQVVHQRYHISMAALDLTSVKDEKEVVSLVVERHGSEFLLCNLQKDSVLQVNLNLFFDKGEKVVFSLKGQGIVHLTGYLVKEDNEQSDCTLQSKKLNDSIMLAKDKVKSSGDANKKFQSKKNLSTQNDSWKVESKEIVTPKKKLFASPSKKDNENFQTNITGILEGDYWEVESEEDKSSAVPAKTIAPPSKKSKQETLFEAANQEMDDSSDDNNDDETSDDDETAESVQRLAQKRSFSALGGDDDDDDDDDEDDEDFIVDVEDEEEDDDEEEEEYDDEEEGGYDDENSLEESSEEDEFPNMKKSAKDIQNNKKFKADTSTPVAGKMSTAKYVPQVIDIVHSKNGDINSSIGRTPMPKKKPESVFQKSALNNSKKAKLANDDSDSDSEDEMETSTGKVKEVNKNKSVLLNTSNEAVSSEKKKKRKKKGKADDSTAANQSTISVNDSFKADGADVTKAQFSKKLQGGVEYEDIRQGNGPVAKKGRMVHVYYTGKLEDNKVFDSCQPGKSKPFAFKLGSGQVIKGWDLAVEGMKVGGKRRIKIPPHMGYKNQRSGPIPPNSTLYFTVEVKAIS